MRPGEARFLLDSKDHVASVIPIDRPEWPDAALVLVRPAERATPAERGKEDLAARNAAILSSSLDGLFIVGPDHRFVEANDAFCRMVGYRLEELTKLRVSELEIAPRDRRNGDGGTSSDLQTGHHLFTSTYVHRDGHRVELEISVTALHSEGRKILVGFARDITERIRSEERLRQAHERLRFHVDRMPLGYIVWSPELRVQEWNPTAESTFGHAAREALGRTADELIGCEEDGSQAARMWSALLAGDHNSHAVLSHRRKDGEVIRCEWFNTALTDQAGKISGIASMVRDISERERLEGQLRESQKLESLGVLAGGVAHDFNNFLVSILCNASLALEELSDPDRFADARTHMQKIVNAGRRASDLTRQMLAYAGRAASDVQPLELNRLIDEMADFMRAAVPRSVVLTTQLHDALPPIDADAGQIQQVVMNLLLNAAEAIGPGGGEVIISTALKTLDARQAAALRPRQNVAPGEFVCLEVRDNGCGMAPETLSRIFDPFFTTKFTGRGLGLAAMLGTIRSHRGAIRVRSREGVGTTFQVFIPAGRRAMPAAAPPAVTAASLAGARTVLVIDDEDDIREVVQEVLESRQVRVLTAENGPRGIELFKAHADEIDLVLLDMMMPGLNGEEVMSEILAMRPDARVVLSSGYSEAEAIERLTDGRPAAFVQKPYTMNTLLTAVSAALHEPAGRTAGDRTMLDTVDRPRA
jgi:PAS domain S-box-containing protein